MWNSKMDKINKLAEKYEWKDHAKLILLDFDC